uniref:Uncharacterized protein n=1 Tax=Oryza sativa subsp. indica TaxID=39946 RepID=Q0P175_ORYSI|nr:hypothetical protein TQH17P5.6 [Oryza sativa Indica Group]AAZ06233.1 hypothetical protein TQH17P5.6 [Oryza sativa Indica Group]
MAFACNNRFCGMGQDSYHLGSGSTKLAGMRRRGAARGGHAGEEWRGDGREEWRNGGERREERPQSFPFQIDAPSALAARSLLPGGGEEQRAVAGGRGAERGAAARQERRTTWEWSAAWRLTRGRGATCGTMAGERNGYSPFPLRYLPLASSFTKLTARWGRGAACSAAAESE